MAKIKPVAKPANQSDEYQFFSNEETGQIWKAKLELKNARPARVDGDIETATAEFAITVTVSPVTAKDGKALRDEGKPIIIDSWTHTFTAVEMAEPNFDPMVRIVGIVAERIEVGEGQLKGNEKVKSFVDLWNGKAKLKTPSITSVTKEPTNE